MSPDSRRENQITHCCRHHGRHVIDILRDTLARSTRPVAGWHTVTLADDDADKITRELDARGIPWGLRMKGQVTTTTSSPYIKPPPWPYIIEAAPAEPRPRTGRIGVPLGAQCCPHHGRDRRPATGRATAGRRHHPAPRQARHLTALVGRFGDMDIEEVNRLAEQIVRELS